MNHVSLKFVEQPGCPSDCILKFAVFVINIEDFSQHVSLTLSESQAPPSLWSLFRPTVTQERRGNLGCRFSPAGAPARTAAILSDAEGLKSQSVPGLQAPASGTLALPFSSQ